MKVSPRFKPYPEYKDSGVEWLGKIPEEWAKLRLKNVISSPVTDGPHETPDFISEGVPFLSVDGIQNGELVFEGCRYISKDAHHIYRKKVNPKKDDLLFSANDIIIYLFLFIKIYPSYLYVLCVEEHIIYKNHFIKQIFSNKTPFPFNSLIKMK